MKEIFIGNYGLEQVGQTMTATGWVANIRNHGKLAFIELRLDAFFRHCELWTEIVAEHEELLVFVVAQLLRDSLCKGVLDERIFGRNGENVGVGRRHLVFELNHC